jgi:AGZA family xanthine/uracil permease-like MFS transporter
LILAVLSFFGIVHSASPDGMMYLPWNLIGIAQKIPYQFTSAYLVFSIMLFVFSFTKESLEPMAEEMK